MKYTPRPYQITGRDFLKARNFAMLGDAPGIGKTGQAIIAINPSWARVLIVCPASVKGQWAQALRDWREYHSQVLGSTKDRVEEKSQFVVTNYDQMIRDNQLAQLMYRSWDLIIFDEAHKLKSITAKRTKAALGKNGLRSRTKRIWFLTGTPRKNRVIDLYPILRSCAPEVLGPYQSYLKFSYRYCGAYQSKFGLDNSGASNVPELAKRMESFMLRREKRDVLTELPPRVLTVVPLECTPQVRQIIKEVEWQTTEQAGENDPALFKLGEIQRMRGALAKYKVPLCADYIKDLLEEEDKIVVFYYHKEVLRALQEAFKETKSVFIDGSVNPHKRGDVVSRFCGDPSTKLFFGQMEACGEGIDGLQRASCTAVFIEPSWSDTDIEQCIGRLERSGQRSDINIHILTIKDTLEARMMDVVAEKLKIDDKLYQKQQNKEKEQMAKDQENVGKFDRTEVEQASITLIAAFGMFMKALKNAALDVPETTGGQPFLSEGAGTPIFPAEDKAAREKMAEKKKAKAEKPQAAPVEVAEEEDVSEEAIRTRAGDICALKPDGTGKAGCAEIVKKIGGGKIVDLKTPKQRVECLAALDALYTKLSEEL